jgi:hypothetical protein
MPQRKPGCGVVGSPWRVVWNSALGVPTASPPGSGGPVRAGQRRLWRALFLPHPDRAGERDQVAPERHGGAEVAARVGAQREQALVAAAYHMT